MGRPYPSNMHRHLISRITECECEIWMIEDMTGVDCIDWSPLASLYLQVGMVGDLGEQGDLKGII